MSSTICRRCGRPLKTASSIQAEMGPTCAAASAGQTSLMPPDANTVYVPWKAGDDVVLRREGEIKYMNVPQTIVRHSPAGMDWFPWGAEPLELALNILFMFTKDKEFSRKNANSFKYNLLSSIPREGGTIENALIWAFINSCLQKEGVTPV